MCSAVDNLLRTGIALKSLDNKTVNEKIQSNNDFVLCFPSFLPVLFIFLVFVFFVMLTSFHPSFILLSYFFPISFSFRFFFISSPSPSSFPNFYCAFCLSSPVLHSRQTRFLLHWFTYFFHLFLITG